MRETLLRNRDFAYFLSAQLISQLGDWIHWVTILAFVYESTHSGMAMASVSIALTATRIAAAPAAGVMADRYNRKAIMVSADFLQAACVSLFLLNAILTRMYAILTVTVCVSVLSSIYEPTKKAVLPMIIQKNELLRANSLMESVMNALWVLGPVTGGGLITILGFKWGFFINACSFLVSGALTLGMRMGMQVQPQAEDLTHVEEKGFVQEVVTGLKYIRKNEIVFILFVSTFTAMLGGGSVNALMATLPHDVYHFSTGVGYALLLSAAGAGWVLGSLFLFGYASRIRQLGRRLGFWVITGILSGLTVIFVVNTPVFSIGCVVWFSHGLFNCIRDIIETTIVQETVHEEVMGRVFSTQGLLVELASIVSMALGGILYSMHGIGVVFTYAGSMEAFSAVMGFFFLYRVVSQKGGQRQK